MIYVPLRFSLQRSDERPVADLAKLVALLEAEKKNGAKIQVDAPALYAFKGDARVQRWLMAHGVPYDELATADITTTHILIGSKLIPVLD